MAYKKNVFTEAQLKVIREFYPQGKYSLEDIARKMGYIDFNSTLIKNISGTAIHDLGLRPRRVHSKTRADVESLHDEIERLKNQIATLTKAGRPVWHAELDGLWFGDILVMELSDADYAPIIDVIVDKLTQGKVDLADYMDAVKKP